MQQEQQHNRLLPDTVISSETYNRLHYSLFAELPQYRSRIQSIRLTNDGIITKPKEVVNLFESSDFVKASRSSLVEGWIILVRMIVEIFERMPINCCLVYQGCKFGVVKGKKEIDFVAYVIVKIDEFITLKHTTSQQDKDQQLLTQIDTLLDLLVQLYQLFVINCNIPQTSFHFISRYLCRRYHSNQLTVEALSRGYQLLTYVGKYQGVNTDNFTRQCSKPFLHFDGRTPTGIKLILTDNSWVFTKLMHICLWLKPFFRQSTESISIVHIKTDDNKILRVIQERNSLAIECLSGAQRSYRSVCDLPINSPIKLQIQLDARQSGLFKSNQYVLNLIINGKQHREIQVRVPRFSSSSYITHFNFLQNYFGVFYSMLVANSEIDMPDSILSQDQLQQFLANEPQSIITVLSPLRMHSKILINHIDPEQNHAYHQAICIQGQAQPISEFYKSPELCLPFLYFCSCIYLDPRFLQLSTPLQQTLNTSFNKILTNLCWYLFNSKNPQTNQTSNNIQLSTLFILYYLQLNRYPITQETLNIILENCCTDTFSGYYLQKYLDFNVLQSMKQNMKEQPSDLNLTTKFQLLYLLETQWKKLWNKLQHCSEWWMPGLKFQRNRQFSHTEYQYKEIQQDEISGPVSWQWIVSQFITNDFCDCLLVPLIRTPDYGDFNHYRQAYINRQMMGEYFDEPDIWKCFLNLGKGTKMKQYRFKQNSQSLANLIKRKLYHSQSLTIPTTIINISYQSLPVEVPKESNQYFEAPVCYMNLLTLVIGTICVRVKPVRKNMIRQHSADQQKNAEQRDDAIISFYPKHDNKQLDHLCVKPFKQEQFKCIYINCQDIKSLRKRRYNQSMNGLQIRLKSGINHLFYFYQTANKDIDKFISKLCPSILPVSIVSKDPYDDYLKSNYTIQWIDKQISNYEYLQNLNDVSGRSYSDITQYPVLPWVFVSDEEQVNFAKLQNYRNLMKNMGSLGPDYRKQFFLEKYEANNEEEIFSEYHFGTHYSSSAIIFNFLIRLRPFSTGAKTLQSGKFDCADRVFSSYIGTWKNATTSTTDIRELVPEIYILPEMMINVNNYDFGLTQLKQRICNVQLPKWAENNPYKFCVILRKALQKQYTTSKIKHWIDLVYGYKQKGKQAIENMNIFFPLTYQLAINLDKISDKEERISFETQIAHFGQNPAQIIGSNPHPDMLALKKSWQNKLIADCNQILLQKCQLPTPPTTSNQHIFQSVFENKKAILGIKFMSDTDTTFFVLRRHQFTIFRILDKKSGFISKQKQVEHQIEKGHISLDYINIQNMVPIIIIDQAVVLVGGLYHGNVHIIFLNDVKYSGNLKINMKTVSALAYDPKYKFVYVGDSAGNLGVYQFSYSRKDALLTERFFDKIHALRINSIVCNHKANLFVTASEDGAMKIFNLYSQQFYRKLINPLGCSVIFASISTSPLYSVVFYSRQDSKLYTYSLNGQYLASKEEVTGFIYNLKVQAASDHTEHAISLNANRELVIDELPFLKAKKRIKLKKDDGEISCFEMTNKIAIAGNQLGGLQILGDASFS